VSLFLNYFFVTYAISVTFPLVFSRIVTILKTSLASFLEILYLRGQLTCSPVD